ncbi:MAG: hypothetical protein SynsKO_26530 [Synoicihabitans sp.]
MGANALEFRLNKSEFILDIKLRETGTSEVRSGKSNEASVKRLEELGIAPRSNMRPETNSWMRFSARSNELNSSNAEGTLANLTALCDQIASLPEVEFVSPIFTDSGGNTYSVRTELIVVSEKNETDSPDFRRGVISGIEGRLKNISSTKQLEHLDRFYIVETSHKNGMRVLEDAAKLKGVEGVLVAEPNALVTGYTSYTPSSQAWGLNNTGSNPIGGGGISGMDLGAIGAWSRTDGDPSIKVLIMDSGVDMGHPAFSHVSFSGADFTSAPAATPGTPGGTHNSDAHGTQVAGTIVAALGSTAYGIAPDVSIATARIGTNYGAGGSFDSHPLWFINALNWGVGIGARISVCSNSLNVSNFISMKYAYVDSRGGDQVGTLGSVYNQTSNDGMLHFAASGNDNVSTVSFPARADKVLGVGAIDSSGNRSTWTGGLGSNWGSGLDFVGPGTATVVPTQRNGSNGPNPFVSSNGTSMATPFVAGVAALLLSQNPSWPPGAIEYRMAQTARDLGATGYDQIFGYGLAQADDATEINSNGMWQLFNLSTRSPVDGGAADPIMGFVIAGTGTKRMLIRGIGPSLSGFGVNDALEDPILTLTNNGTGGTVATNNNWGSASNFSEIKNLEYGQFPIPDNSLDSAILVDLSPGVYTASLSKASGAGRIGLTEVYDVTETDEGESDTEVKLANLSSRVWVESGDASAIAGFVTQAGNGVHRQVLVRAVGPTLSDFGVPNALSDPKISIVASNGTVIAQNDDWNTNSNAAQISSFGASVGAFGLANGTKDAALLVSMTGGAFTVVVEGVGGATGIALIEIYIE